MNMKKFNIIVVCLLGLFIAVPAMADMKVSLEHGVGTTNGGEFLITVEEGTIGIYPETSTFSSFCVERDEYINYSTVYVVTISTDAIEGGVGGPSPDPLSPQSAYLYSLWIDEVVEHNETYADAIQKAIWYQENEISSISGLAKVYSDEAEAAVVDGGVWFEKWGPDSIGDIRVMNLWTEQGCHAQDQLVRVPVPGAVLLGMLGLGAAGLKLRKFA
jgi:hypothetical protein